MGKRSTKLWCVTMIDPATGWFEMEQIKDKKATTIADIVERIWLMRYLWPELIIFDKEKKFLGEFAEMITKDYHIKRKPITTRNPQANAVLERIHQTIGNSIRTFEVLTNQNLNNDPWKDILSAVMHAVRATIHTTLNATPAQLVFGRDAILNTKFEADWKFIRQRKQFVTHKNNEQENTKIIPHNYEVGSKILSNRSYKSNYGQNPWEGPYTVVRVYNNGTVRIQKNNVTDLVNIRLIKPYHE